MSTLRLDELTCLTAAVGMTNPLPPLTSPVDLHVGIHAGDADDAMRLAMAYGRLDSVLPYLVQDGYSRVLRPARHRTAVVENERLRATFLLGLGGRLWSLVDLATGRELLYRNSVVQPANLALRNAWFAGGVEWNLGTTGHTAQTCEPVHAARVELDDGTDVLRMYEYERTRGLVYQLDVWLPPGSPDLFVHVRITNPHAVETPVYWWSNIAVPEASGVRVLTDASHAWTFDHEPAVRRVSIPVHDGVDRSYPARWQTASDYFFDLRSSPRPWIAAVDAGGVGLLQTSTSDLRGRKMFGWGTGPGGRHWQHWLSPAGGSYLEIQAGLARTQLEHLALPARTQWSWVESYGRLDVDPSAVHGSWPEAVTETRAALEQRCASSLLASREAEACAFADRAPVQMLQAGSGWGALEQRRRTSAGEPDLASSATPFPNDTMADEQEPWLALLEGRRHVGDPGRPPPSYQVSAGWRALLERADGWHGLLLLGVARWHAGDPAGAQLAWRESLNEQPTAWAWRNLAVSETAADRPAEALAAYDRAVELAPDVPALQLERLEAIASTRDPQAVLAAVDTLAGEERGHPLCRLVEARAAVEGRDARRAAALLEPGLVLPGLREGDRCLEELWRAYRTLRRARDAGLDASDKHRAAALTEPLPWAYDFRMHPDDT